MKLNHKQIEAVLLLPGPQRYSYFIKKVADWEEVWGLYADGWALAATSDEQQVLPLWPAREYADLCARDKWSGYVPKSVPLQSFMSELLPNLARDGVLPGVFYTPSDHGVVQSINSLLADLNAELSRYQ
jgi:hypothetical protein